MNLQKNDLLVYAITDRSWVGNETLEEQVEQALKGGITMLQLREKDMDYEQLKQEAIAIQQMCRSYQVPFIINDYVRLAKEIGADGVHIGQSDCSVMEARRILGPDIIIGATAKTVEQALTAQEQGADYLGSGAVFGSNTKKDAKPMEHELLQKICEAVTIPVVAIGGINGKNVTALKGRGMAGVAVIGGIFGEKDIMSAAADLKRKMGQMI